MAMLDYEVLYKNLSWVLLPSGKEFPTKEKAVRAGKAAARVAYPSRLIVRDKSGFIRATFQYESLDDSR